VVVPSLDIRANTNLRIGLRMTDGGESVDVLDAPDAARIARSTPGRAFARLGHTSLVAFQAGRVGGRHPSPDRADRGGDAGAHGSASHSSGLQRSGLRESGSHGSGSRAPTRAPWVVRLPWAALGGPLPRRPEADMDADDGAASDLRVLVDEIRTAAELTGVPRQRGPWLPPLPSLITLGDLLARAHTPVPPPAARDGARISPTRLAPIPIGLSDLPADQAQHPYRIDLEAPGHLMVVGSARSGRSTVLRTFAGALAATVSSRDAHLFGLDCGNNALLALTALPHTGAVVSADTPERVERLFARLRAQVAARQEAFAGRGYADLGEQRAAEPAAALPYLVLLLDRFEAFLAAFEDRDGGRLVDELTRLLREGPAVGLRVLITADRRGLTGRVASAIENRLVLRLADRADYPLAGLVGSAVPSWLPPGRGFRIGGAEDGAADIAEDGIAAVPGPDGDPAPGMTPLTVETQIALLSPDPAGRAQVAALARLGASAAARDGVPPGPAAGPRDDPRRPMRVDVLPTRITLAEASALTEPPWSPARPVGPRPPAGMPGHSSPATIPDSAAVLDPAATLAMPTASATPPRPLLGLVAVGGDELGPVIVDLAEDGPGFTVAGPARSGRSTMLVTLATTLLAGGTRLLLVTPRPSPLRALADAAGVLGSLGATAGIDDLSRLLPPQAGRDGMPPTVVLVDDAELLVDSPLAGGLTDFLRGARDARSALVAAGTTEDLLGQFRGFLVDLRRSGCGLLLWPGGPADGELFGRRLSHPAGGARPPGRGLYFQRGLPTPLHVQVPIASDHVTFGGSHPRKTNPQRSPMLASRSGAGTIQRPAEGPVPSLHRSEGAPS